MTVLIVAIIAFALLRPDPGQKAAEITYWGIWENEAIFNEIIQEFEEQYPHISIKYENKSDIKDVPGGYIAYLKTRMDAGTGPDVFRFHNSWVSMLSSHLAPLPSSVTSEVDLEKNYFPVITSDMESGGAYYGVPLGYDSLVMYVNEDIVKAGGYTVPQDWTTFMDVARSLTVIDEQTGEIKTSGTSLGTYDNVAHAADIISLLAVQSSIDMAALAGIGGKTPEESVQKQAVAKDKMVGVLDFYTCFAVENDICTPIWNNDLPNSKLAFVQGKVAFYFGYSWDILEINQANPNFEFSVHNVPRYDSSQQGGATLAGYWAEGVSIKSKAQAQAFEFLKFLSKKENMEKLFKAQASQRAVAVAYPRLDMASLLSNNPYLGPVIAQAPAAKSSLFYSDTYGGGNVEIMDRSLGNAVRSIQSGEQSPQSAVDTLSNGLQSIFNPKPNEEK
ncbi:MAG TPA: extracellular solute-binding protein [Candidatus Levybacteria bacterium]|nr:extracellular solute-binding protein [Candidatus Levybacteria bacterium]